MSKLLEIIIVQKNGTLKPLNVKELDEAKLYLKCGFKSSEYFCKQVDWNVKIKGTKYLVQVFGKKEGRANLENKYDFPPPIDKTLLFGSCAIVAKTKQKDDKWYYTNLSVALWNEIYEKLFGGFEDLSATQKEDEEEEDELEHIPKEKKTKHGYLKDGFVVDNSDDDDDYDDDTVDESVNDHVEELDKENDDSNDEQDFPDVYSELSEEEYIYEEK